MPSQFEIAAHLGLSQKNVSVLMHELGIDWRTSSMDEIRLAYIGRLRAAASGHQSADGQLDLVAEKAKTERIVRELKSLELERLRGSLVAVEDLERELAGMVTAFRTEMLARDDKLVAEIATLYNVEVDRQLLHEHTVAALLHLSRYDPDGASRGPALGGYDGAAEHDRHDGMGTPVSTPERKKQRKTRHVST
jgi:hypothetical protein